LIISGTGRPYIKKTAQPELCLTINSAAIYHSRRGDVAKLALELSFSQRADSANSIKVEERKMKKLCALSVSLGVILFLMFIMQGCKEETQANETQLPETAAPKNMDDEFAQIITGVLVDENDKPMANQSMLIYSGKTETTLNTKLGESETVKKIEGTGTINFDIEGIEGGGSYKLVDGKTVNPSTKTDEAGRFRFEVSAEFIEGEEDLIIVRQQAGTSSFETESLPMIDQNGNPVKLKVDKQAKVLDLGRIRTLQKRSS
jgi:hypothetical protein